MNRKTPFQLLLVLSAVILLSGCGQRALPAASAPTSLSPAKPTSNGMAGSLPSPTYAATPSIQISPTLPSYDTPEPLPTGIREIGDLGRKPCDCTLEGAAWRGVLNGWYLNVYAGGSFGFDSGQGLVMLDSQTIDGHSTMLDFFPTPTRNGSVRIVSANGLRLTLLSTDGTQFIFDAGLRAWISSSGTPIPAPTITGQ